MTDRISLTWRQVTYVVVGFVAIVIIVAGATACDDSSMEAQRAPPASDETAAFTHTIRTELQLTDFTLRCVELDGGWELAYLDYHISDDGVLLELEREMWAISIDRDDQYEEWEGVEALDAAMFIGDCATLVREGEQDWMNVER